MQTQNKNIPGVGVILIHGGKFLLQLRDDNPDILNPNKWGFVGGGIDQGEKPEEAIERECMEEIGIIPNSLMYIGHTSDSKFRFYAYLSDQEVEKLHLGEGQEIRFFAPHEMSELNTTPRVKAFFNEYRQAVEKFINREEVTAEDLGLEK
ncbi:MAG: NUDIX domain-containing protein [Candidatus Paceibacterota bacterium]|jgi:mutator protein MutT